MPEGPDGKTIIIVKKVSGHGGHHGGAWKVAYADFVTAMMALFMVLWLVNSAAEPTRQRIASYFRKPGIFEKGSGTPLEMGGGGILPDTFAPPADANSQIITSKKIYVVDAHTGKVKDYFDPGKGGESVAAQATEQPPPPEPQHRTAETPENENEELPGLRPLDTDEWEQIKDELEKAAGMEGGGKGEGEEAKAGAKEVNFLGQVDIKVDQRGLLLEIMDTDSASMFELGSASIQTDAEKQLLRIAAILRSLPNPIDIEGHTDARPYRGKNSHNYDNWNLSVDRANAARRVLQQVGIPDDKIARVVGYAAQRPKVPEQPLDPSNRRITIAMRFTAQAKQALEGTKTVETTAKPIVPPKAPPPVQQQQHSEAPKQPTAAAPVKPQEPLQSKQEEKAPPVKELRIDVGTTMPEGAVVIQPDEPGVEHGVIEKDKIFGRGNPFFSE